MVANRELMHYVTKFLYRLLQSVNSVMIGQPKTCLFGAKTAVHLPLTETVGTDCGELHAFDFADFDDHELKGCRT